MIEIENLTERFSRVRALDGLVDLTALDGRATGLVGPNGAGMTTAFRPSRTRRFYGPHKLSDGSDACR